METKIDIFLDGLILRKPAHVIAFFTEHLYIPYSSGDWDQLFDWLCDLEWLPYKTIVFHFFHSRDLLKGYPHEQRKFWILMDDLKRYWDEIPICDDNSKSIVIHIDN